MLPLLDLGLMLLLHLFQEGDLGGVLEFCSQVLLALYLVYCLLLDLLLGTQHGHAVGLQALGRLLGTLPLF